MIQEEQDLQPRTSIVPFQEQRNAYAAGLPDETTDLLGAYDVEMDEPHEGLTEMQQLAGLLSLDVYYDLNQPGALTLKEIREQQGKQLGLYLTKTAKVIRSNYFFLGFLIIQSLERKLYEYMGYTSIEEWCEDLAVDSSMLKKARHLALLWPWLRTLGYTPQDVVDGSITEAKVVMLERLMRERKNARLAHEIAVYKIMQHQEEDDEEEETAPDTRAISRAIDLLPDTQQQELRTQVQTRYLHQARSEVERIRELRESDLFKEQDELRGNTNKPYIIHHCTRQGKKIVGTFEFACGSGEIFSLIANQTIPVYVIDDQPAKSTSQFGEYLNECENPDWTQTI